MTVGSRSCWEIYERMVARLMADQIGTDMCVTANARIRGRISGRSRQIDVLIEARHEPDASRRVVVDVKNRARKVDVTDVEAFLGLLADVEATHGYLVCPTGHTKAAEKRAQMAVTIALVPMGAIPNFDPSSWPACIDTRCKGGRIFWDGHPELSLTLVPILPSSSGRTPERRTFVHDVGKCDRCGRFHVHCTTCGDILLTMETASDIGQQCRCKLPWFWIASIENEEGGGKNAELHVVLATGEIRTVDRRPI